MPKQPVKWETIVKTYDKEGQLISETTTVVIQETPESTDQIPGMYL